MRDKLKSALLAKGKLNSETYALTVATMPEPTAYSDSDIKAACYYMRIPDDEMASRITAVSKVSGLSLGHVQRMAMLDALSATGDVGIQLLGEIALHDGIGYMAYMGRESWKIHQEWLKDENAVKAHLSDLKRLLG